ncbi:MAG: TetR/AcrR family transcriptional regulator [Myxococcota bacterium]
MQINDLETSAEPAAGPPPSALQRTVSRSLERRRALYEAEVERLVRAAFELIRRTGDLEPRVSEIVSQAGMCNQAFYKHFRSKRELLVAVLDEGNRLLAGYLQHRMDRSSDPLERIREWLRGILEQALNPEAAESTRPFVVSRGRLAEAFPDEVVASERQITALVRESIAAAAESGRLPHADPERDAETLYHLAMGWLQERLRPSPADTAANARDAERVVEFALAGLRRSGGESTWSAR